MASNKGAINRRAVGKLLKGGIHFEGFKPITGFGRAFVSKLAHLARANGRYSSELEEDIASYICGAVLPYRELPGLFIQCDDPEQFCRAVEAGLSVWLDMPKADWDDWDDPAKISVTTLVSFIQTLVNNVDRTVDSAQLAAPFSTLHRLAKDAKEASRNMPTTRRPTEGELAQRKETLRTEDFWTEVADGMCLSKLWHKTHPGFATNASTQLPDHFNHPGAIDHMGNDGKHRKTWRAFRDWKTTHWNEMRRMMDSPRPQPARPAKRAGAAESSEYDSNTAASHDSNDDNDDVSLPLRRRHRRRIIQDSDDDDASSTSDGSGEGENMPLSQLHTKKADGDGMPQDDLRRDNSDVYPHSPGAGSVAGDESSPTCIRVVEAVVDSPGHSSAGVDDNSISRQHEDAQQQQGTPRDHGEDEAISGVDEELAKVVNIELRQKLAVGFEIIDEAYEEDRVLRREKISELDNLMRMSMAKKEEKLRLLDMSHAWTEHLFKACRR